MFSSSTNNNSNSWNTATSFGKSLSFAGPSSTSGGLFGNSASGPNTGGGLFGQGNSNSGTSGATGGGLFGNSNSSAPKPPALSAAGGLFGSSNQATQNQPSATSGGLFGSSNQQSATSGGLFGSSNQLATQNQQSATNGGLFGNSALSGLSFNQNQNQNQNSGSTVGGLFGSAKLPGASSSGGLFGSSTAGSNLLNLNSNNTGLFSNSNNNISINNNNVNANSNGSSSFNANPYNYDTSFAKIRQNVDLMPNSITESLFLNDDKTADKTKDTSRKRGFSEVSKPNLINSLSPSASSSSLLSRLGQTIRYFRSNFSSGSSQTPSIAKQDHDPTLKGIFTASNYVSYKSSQNGSTNVAAQVNSNKRSRQSPSKYPARVYSGQLSDFKKLVIKSKPLKFHLIDTEKVFNSKRRRVLVEDEKILLSDDILNKNGHSFLIDDEYDDEDDFETSKSSNYGKHYSRSAYNSNKNVKQTIINQDKLKEENKLDDRDLNNGYWCSPSISELTKLSVKELSEVDNFIIGRVGYGQISYNYPVDLSGAAMACKQNEETLNNELFGKIVQFKKKHLLVYENFGDEKPPIGFGLNVPATITLENIFAKDGENSSQFIKKLQNLKGMDFVTYDLITGSWVFKVMHFSVWGLVDEEDNEENDEKLLAIKRNQDSREEESRLEAFKIYGTPEYRDEIKRQKLKSYTNQLPGGWEKLSESQLQDRALAIKRGLVEQEVNQELNNFVEEQRMHHINDDVADITIDEEEEDNLIKSPDIYNGDADARDRFDETYGEMQQGKLKYLKQLVSVLPRNIDLNDLVDEKAYEPEVTDDQIFDNIQVRPNLAISDDWLVQLELSNDINSSLNPLKWNQKNLPEIESGRGILGSDLDNILFNDFNKEASKIDIDMDEIDSKSLAKLSDSKKKLSSTVDTTISKVLRDLLLKSEIKSRDTTGYPKVSSTADFTFQDLFLLDSDLSIVKLCYALFEDIPLSTSLNIDTSNKKLVTHLRGLQRRKLLKDWLEELNGAAVEDLIKKSSETGDSLATIFYILCLGDIKRAVEVATNSRNNHLAVLLTQIDANDSGAREIALAQLKYWNQNDTSEFIPKSLIKIYSVLAGEFDDVINDLPWNIGFALKYIYGSLNNSLSALVEEFQNQISSGPIKDVLNLVVLQEGENHPGHVIDSLQASENIPLKLKWLISVIFSSGKGKDFVPDALTSQFGQYLVANGLWKDAVYVYSRLHDDQENSLKTKELIFENIEEILKTSSENYLVEALKIPQSVIFEAIAENEGKRGNHWQQCEAYVKAKLWEKVHDCITAHIGPSTVISKNLRDRNQLLEIVDQIPQRGLIIPQWAQGAGIFVQYVELLKYQHENFTEYTEEYKSLINSLITNIPLIKTSSTTPFESSVALIIISKKVGDWAIKMGGFSKEKILSLKLGENELQYFKNRLAIAEA